jgi:cell division protein FtsZ
VAAKSIAEIITLPGLINLDFADVKTTMKNGGVTLISNGYGEGDGRVRKAIDDALKSPLLNNNDIFTARKILFNISFSDESELLMEEMDDIHVFMAKFNTELEVIWGTTIDNTLGSKVKMTLLATGFGVDDIPGMAEKHQADKERIKGIYGKAPTSNGQSTPTFIILSTEELDDDEFIYLLEVNPTYNRDMKIIKDFQNARKTINVSGNSPATNGNTNMNVAISF